MPLVAQELPKKVLGKYSDGDGLLFRVTRGGTRDWFLKVQYRGKRREYALGKYPDLGLSDARAKARIDWRKASDGNKTACFDEIMRKIHEKAYEMQ